MVTLRLLTYISSNVTEVLNTNIYCTVATVASPAHVLLGYEHYAGEKIPGLQEKVLEK